MRYDPYLSGREIISLSHKADCTIIYMLAAFIVLCIAGYIIYRRFRGRINVYGYRLHQKASDRIQKIKEDRIRAYGYDVTIDDEEDGGMWPTQEKPED